MKITKTNNQNFGGIKINDIGTRILLNDTFNTLPLSQIQKQKLSENVYKCLRSKKADIIVLTKGNEHDVFVKNNKMGNITRIESNIPLADKFLAALGEAISIIK